LPLLKKPAVGIFAFLGVLAIFIALCWLLTYVFRTAGDLNKDIYISIPLVALAVFAGVRLGKFAWRLCCAGKSPAVGTAAYLVALAWFALLWFVSYSVASLLGEALQMMFFVAVLGIWIAFVTTTAILRFARRHHSPSATEVLRTDPRPPIIYLRSFVDERRSRDLFRGRSPEERLTGILGHLGPVIALQDQGESLPYIGATRLLTSDASWQATLLDLMPKSGLTVVQVSYRYSPGLLWEFSILFKQVPFRPVLLVFPFAYAGIGSQREGYQDFKLWFQEVTGFELPGLSAGTSAILFHSPENSESIALNSREALDRLLRALDGEAFARYHQARNRSLLVKAPIAVGILISFILIFSAAIDHQLGEERLRQGCDFASSVLLPGETQPAQIVSPTNDRCIAMLRESETAGRPKSPSATVVLAIIIALSLGSAVYLARKGPHPEMDPF
jgi:hypothetical protein